MHASSYRPSESSDPFGRYYTDSTLGNLLVSQMTVRRPLIVLDLGAGDGALSQAALSKWREARVLAVDSDPEVSVSSTNARMPGNLTIHADALNPDLSAEIALPMGSVGAAVCNPPFIRPRWRKQFAELLEDAGLGACYPAIEEAGAAVLFLAQNIRFLRTGGQVGLIVPDGLVSGVNHRRLRQALVEQHTITEAIELPNNAFPRAEVKTHILIIRKGRQGTNKIRLRRFGSSGLTMPLYVQYNNAIHRLDYSYYERASQASAQLSKRGRFLCLKDLNPELQRGRASSVDCSTLPLPVFHTTNFPASCRIAVGSSWHWDEKTASRHGQILAWPGDILLGRVGRNLEHKVGVLVDGPVAITDCVYRLRVSTSHLEAVIERLTSSSGRALLASSASGSGARHLSKAELLSMPLWPIH